MRRLLAAVSAALLALAMTVPIASAQEGSWIDGFTITQATVYQKTGEVHITGYAWCHNLGDSGFEAQGQLKQAMGRKTTVQGGVWGNIQCASNGPASFDLWSTADYGMFGTGWGSIAFNFGFNNCNEFGCWWESFGGVDWTVIKIVKK